MENQNVEYKEKWSDEYLKWICGFANANGGTLFIGKKDDGSIKGVENSRKLLEEIPNKTRDTLGIIVDVNVFAENYKEYIEIVVQPNLYPVSYRGEFHYRAGTTKQQLTGQALNQFLLKKTGVTWDSIPVENIAIHTIRNDSFDIFRDQALLSKRMISKDLRVSNLQLLDNLNLLDGKILKKAGVLLFHHNPEKWIPRAFIKIGYFESDSELCYQDEVHGPLIIQAMQTVDLIYTKYLKAAISYKEITRIETYPFSKEAIREAVFNAIIHKNYATLVPIQISVYKDKLYIANDCIFPEDWTVEDILEKHKSRPYNPLIASTFFRAGFVESWGRGIEKINEACKVAGSPVPDFKIKKEDFMIKFFLNEISKEKDNEGISEGINEGINEGISEGINEGISEGIKSVLNVIKDNPGIKARAISTILDNRSIKTIERQLSTLIKRQLVEYKGSKKVGGYYIL